MTPTAPKKPCTYPGGCPELTTGGRCETHKRPNAYRRGYDKQWQRLSRAILARDPICKACNERPSTQADHIVPKNHPKWGGRRKSADAPSNLQGLCLTCHSSKTAREDGGFGR